jgi:hypothetical protein
MTDNKKFKGVGKLEKPLAPVAAEQLSNAQQTNITEAYALVHAIENEKVVRQTECWKEISNVASKYGFTVSASHQPVNISIELIPKL